MGEHPVKVLQVQIGGKTFSGVASYLYQYYKHMDHTRVKFDFLFCRENSMELVKNDPELKDSAFFVLNAVRGKSNDYLAIQRGIHQILKEEHYDAVVVNTSIVAVIYSCMLAMRGIKGTKFIAHAHNTDLVLGKNSLRAKFLIVAKALDGLMRIRIRKRADYLFACTDAAGAMTFGQNAIRMDKYRLVKNAIDLEEFAFDSVVRGRVRKALNTKESIKVYGNVGSFCKRKNQSFLIRTFEKIHKCQPNSELWLIGDGNDRGLIEDLVTSLGLQDSIKLLGQRSDVNELMQGMDFFVFPTLSEGLGIVAIEAQAAGLPTFVSDGVPRDVLISERAVMLELEKGENYWSNTILKCKEPSNRIDVRTEIANAGFNIQREAEGLTEFLCSML